MSKRTRVFIEDAKGGVTDGGIACGPCGGALVSSVKFRVNGQTKWLSCHAFESDPHFLISDEDIFDKLSDDFPEEEDMRYIESLFIEEFNGLDLENFEESAEDDPDNWAIPLIRYARCLAFSCNKETEELIAAGKGHYADECEVSYMNIHYGLDIRIGDGDL